MTGFTDDYDNDFDEFEEKDWNTKESWEKTEEDEIIELQLKAALKIIEKQQYTKTQEYNQILFWSIFSNILSGYIANGADVVDKKLMLKCFDVYENVMKLHREISDEK